MRSGICLSCAINGQAVCEADDKAPKVWACEYDVLAHSVSDELDHE